MGFEFINDLVRHINLTLDLSFDQMNLILCMLGAFPIGYINRFIKNPNVRLKFGLITGALLQFQMFGWNMLHVVVATLNTYLFILFLGRKVSSFYVLIFNICHLSFLHLSNMFSEYAKWTLGIDALYMMSICKFSSIAFNYEDGGKDEKDIKSSYHREKMIKEKPTLLETFSFVFYFPSSLIGPSFEFSDFIKFIRLEGCYKNIPWKKANSSSLKELAQMLLLLSLKVKFCKGFTTLYCGTDEFVNEKLWYKLYYFIIAMVEMRGTYYIAWKLCQSVIDFSGLSYHGKTENFDKIEICNLEKIEFDLNPRVIIQYWNRTVHLWLKYYVFLRLINIEHKIFKNNKAMASLITFTLSAVWHGFYPVYYLFFFEYYMIEQVSAYFEETYDVFTKIEKIGFIWQMLYKIFLMFFLQFFGLSFSILSLKENWNFYKSFYFVPLVLLIGVWIYTKITKVTKKKINVGEQDIDKVKELKGN